MGFRGARLLSPLLLALAAASCGSTDDPLPVGQQTEAIVNGTRTAAGQLPGVGLFLVIESKDIEICTATLISDQLLLTAAHCVTQLAAGSEVGFFTGSDITAAGAANQALPVASYTAHPGFTDAGQPPGDLTDYKDIAVAQLAAPTSITPVKMIRPDEVGTLLKVGASVLIAGYGERSPSNSASVGVKAEGTSSLSDLGASELRIGGPPAAQTCDGDSGGPTLAGPTDDQRIIGVTSRGGKHCNEGSIVTRVDSYLSWIHSFGTIPCGSGLSPECPGQQDPLASGGGCSVDPAARPTPSKLVLALLLALWLGARAAARRWSRTPEERARGRLANRWSPFPRLRFRTR